MMSAGSMAPPGSPAVRRCRGAACALLLAWGGTGVPADALGQEEASSRATVIELSPAAQNRGIVRLSPAATAEDVIQPVLEIERGKTVLLKPSYVVKRIAVGDSEIVDVVVNGPSEIQLIAKAVGDTNILIWDAAQDLQASIDIHVGAVRAQVVRELQRVLGRNDVSVDMAGDAIVLRGSVPDLTTSEAAEAVARAFFVGPGGGGEGATAGDGRVLNLLSVGGNQQVMLEVKIAEMSRTFQRALGANLLASFGKRGETFTLQTLPRGLTSVPNMTVTSPLTSMTTVTNDIKAIASLVNRDSLSAQLFLEIMESEQLGKVLAEPTLVARSGELASFLSGGEIPIPVPQDDGNITIIFKRFGVQLEFIPTVLSKDRIHLQVTPEVSQPSPAQGISVQAITVPAFTTRRASTGVELADGQSFVIGGLLQETVTTSYEQFPLLGEVPVLGSLFRSSRFLRNESELVIVVTPRLVQPLGPDPVFLPTDSYTPPSTLGFYLLGRLEGRPEPGAVGGPGFQASAARPYSVFRAIASAGAQTSPERDPGPPPSVRAEEGGGIIGGFGHSLPIPRPSEGTR